MPERFDLAEQRGARFMRLTRSFFIHPPPPVDVPNDGLSALRDVDALDNDALAALAAVALQRFHLRREGAAEFIQAAFV